MKNTTELTREKGSQGAIWHISNKFGPFSPLITMFLLGSLLLSLSRISLVLWQLERVNKTGCLALVLLQGIRVDIIQLSLLALTPLLFAPLLAIKPFFKFWQKFTYVWVITVISLMLFLEVVTPGFITEYDVRPNRLFIEYLKYPHELVSMLWGGFRIHVFFSIGVIIFAIFLMRCFMHTWLSAKPTWSNKKIVLIWPFICLLAVGAIRSTTGHRPANPALFAITQDSMVNSLILNSGYSVFYALYDLRHEIKSSQIYGKMSREDIFNLTGATNTELPTLKTLIPSAKRDKPLNLVILLQESLGARFVTSLGGKPVTPNLEKLKHEGIWFEQLYATGTRSVRGIEAVVAGFQPTPAESTVKLSLSQKNFFTIASLLKKQHYDTEFIYGGESHFDSMRSFFLGNGFTQIIDQKNYKNPVFIGSWGVSDEDLLNKAHEQLMTHYASGKPFFTLVFSSSNHAPFQFPDGRIELYEQPKAKDNNAVKYADYAIGKFFEKAKNSPYWKSTVFLIVADHDIRVRGNTLVPIENFHIPGLILGADIQPQIIKSIVSQIDLPVTVLSLMGIQGQHPMTGKDLTKLPANYLGRAIMQYYNNFAWMQQTEKANKIVVLRERQAPVFGVYDTKSRQLTERAVASPEAKALVSLALANSLLPTLLYQEQSYHLP